MSESYFTAAAALGILFFISILFSMYQKNISSRARLAASFMDLILTTLSTVLILYLILDISDMVQAFAPATVAVVCGSLIAAFRLVMRFILERKRKLTDQQKAELMDL